MLLIHGWTWYKKWAWTCSGESTLLEGGRTIRDYLRWILIYILRLTSYLVAYSSCLQHIPIVHFLHLFIIVFDSSLYYLKLQSNITIFLITHLNSVTKYRLTKRYRTKNLKNDEFYHVVKFLSSQTSNLISFCIAFTINDHKYDF